MEEKDPFWASPELEKVIQFLLEGSATRCAFIKGLKEYHPELFAPDGDHLVKATISERAHYDWGYAIGLRDAARLLKEQREKALNPPTLAEEPPPPIRAGDNSSS